MPKNRWLLSAAWLLLCGWCSNVSVASTTISHPGSPYTIDVWDTEDGLPQNSVISMIQTRDGYLWLGTLNGLVRFDGIRFIRLNEADAPGLTSSRIVHLFEDSRSNLWVGTESAGVELVRNGRVISLDIGRGSREGRLMSACEDSTGAVWLYTADGQLCRFQNGNMNISPRVGALGPGGCRCLAAEQSGPVWVGTDWGMFAINPAAVSTQAAPTVAQTIRANQRLDFLLASRTGGYWRLADGRIEHWKGSTLERDLGPYPWSNVVVSAACEDLHGNLIVGTLGSGVYWFDAAGGSSRISSGQGLSHDTVLSVCVDREGNLWIGTDGGGLNRVKRQVFDVLEMSRAWTVRSVCQDAQGGLWLGTFGGGLKYWREGIVGQMGAIQGLTQLNVGAVLADRGERVWIGTYGLGLFQFQNGLFLKPPGSEALNQYVSAIYEDRSGQLWVGTQGGLAQWDGQNWKVFTTREGLSSDDVRAIADDAEGNVWVGTAGGLNRLRDGKFTSFHKQDGLPGEEISCLCLDDAGVLWIGTASGLARFYGGKWTTYISNEELAGNSVGYLIEDGQGNLWLGSNAGLLRVPKKVLNDFAEGLTNFIPCRAYGKADGLPTRECSSGSQPAACRTKDGKLWFPTIKGLVSVNPAELVFNTNPPPVIIETVLIEGQRQNTNGLRAPLPQSVTVPPGKERLDIQYTGLNLSAPDKGRFRYRLEGHETTWTDVAANVRAAHYTKLPPGHYRFQVTGCNEDGKWNDAGSELAIVVLPPFWQTWWFRSAMTAGILGMIVAVVHYLSTQKLQRQLETLRQREALEKERARIARDIHDQLGASLTQVSLLGELMENDKDSPLEVEAHAKQICQTALDTTRALDEIVWTVNPSNDTLDGLITYVCKYAQDYFAVAGLRYRIDAPDRLPDATISPEVRHNVFLASKEAVTNVVRHAHASEVRIHLRVDSNAFTLEIEDNGRGVGGLDERAARSRNGLRNMRKRMEDIGGAFSIDPAPEGGTRVRLTVPIGNH